MIDPKRLFQADVTLGFSVSDKTVGVAVALTRLVFGVDGATWYGALLSAR